MNPLPAEERVAVFGPSKIHYRVHGSRSGLPEIVLDHGGGGSADDWNLVVPLLAARGRVISYDRAGMGNSPSDGLGCGGAAASARLAQLVEHAEVRKPFVLAGYSLGGLYARHYAQLYPEHVAGLVLVDSTPTALEIPRARIAQAMRVVTLLHWVARSGLGTVFGVLGGRKMPMDNFKRMVARLAAPDYLKRMREEMAAIAVVQAEVASVAPQLRHPTLAVLAGVAPRQMSVEEFVRVREMHEQLAQTAPAPLSRMVVVDGANHGSLMSDSQNAAKLAEHILAFARSWPSIG